MTVAVPVPPEAGFTAGEFLRMRLGHRWVELIDGRIVVNPSPRPWHALAVRRLADILDRHDEFFVFTELDLQVDQDTVLEPDILVRSAETFDLDEVTRASDVLLVVEVWSVANRAAERTSKAKRYAEAGIPHFWAVTRNDPGVVVATYRLDPGSGTYVKTGDHNEVLRTRYPWPIEAELGRILDPRPHP